MANKLETIAENKKKAILAKQEEDVARFANKVANQVLSKVDFSHSEHSTKELQEIISGLSTAVAGAIVLSNEKIDGNLKDNFSQLLNAVKNNKPDNTNQVKLNKEIGRSLAKFELALDAMEFAPQITVAGLSQEELKMEVDKILAKLPASSKREVTIAYEKATADKYINVRLTDGIKFYSAFSSGGGGGGSSSPTVDTGDGVLAVPVANPDGTPLSLGSSSVSTATSDGVTVGDSSTTVLAINENRKSATIVNDSDETIYLKLGSGASLNSGVRINANGGSAKITEYTGIITAICASGDKIVTVTEL